MFWITIPLTLTVLSFGPAQKSAQPASELPGASKAERYQAQAEAQRQGKVEKLQKEMQRQLERLTIIKKARIGIPRGSCTSIPSEKHWIDQHGRHSFTNGAAKRTKLKALNAEIRKLQEIIRATKNQTVFVPDITYGGLKVGNMGSFGTGAVAKVFQVIDQNEALLCIGGLVIWFRGIDARTLVDEQEVELVSLFEITGTATYTTPIGSTKTVLVAEPLVLPEADSKNAQPSHSPDIPPGWR